MLPFPPTGRAMRTFEVRQATGWDALITHLPNCIRIPIFAKKIARALGAPAGSGELTFSLPDGTVWEVLDGQGTARPFTPTKES